MKRTHENFHPIKKMMRETKDLKKKWRFADEDEEKEEGEKVEEEKEEE